MHVREVGGILHVRGEPQSACVDVLGDHLGQAGFVERHLPAPKGRQLVLVVLHSQDVIAEFGHSGGMGGAEISATDHTDLHDAECIGADRRRAPAYHSGVKIVMTMMVRDEIDIIVPVVEYHLAQGVDLFIVTDNGSVDGTADVLKRYADLGVVELHHDPMHRKQQGTVVTQMARRAFTEHGADWVINGDADEFLVPLDRQLSVREALEHTPVSLAAFTVPVVNLVSTPAERGSGIDRLVWRDTRTTEQLIAVGIRAQPTPNAIHVGNADITVAQGNHFVSLKSEGQPDPAYSMEVLHLPWRSWSQFEQKVLHAGRAYEASPNLRPSKNHHGMADYRRALEGRLREAFSLRLPREADLADPESFVEDRWLSAYLNALAPGARLPHALADALRSTDDEPWSVEEHTHLVGLAKAFMALELSVRNLRDEAEEQRATVQRLRQKVRALRAERNEAREAAERTQEWVPVRTDVARVGRRVAWAVRNRLPR